MKRFLLLALIVSVFAASDAAAQPGFCDCYGGMDPDLSPSWWYLLDYFGYPLEDGDWVYGAWIGSDGEIDPPDENGYPTGDDTFLVHNVDYIEYCSFFICVTTWWEGALDSLGNQRRPMADDIIYCRIFDGPKGSIGPGNYYGDSQTYQVIYVPGGGEEFFCAFPGDPGGGHTDTPVPGGEVAVELMSFQALGRDGQVLLEWRTASEVDNLGFHIERSTDAAVFQRITGRIIAGAGDSEMENTYTYVDKGLTNGTTYYYNLIAVDRDGTEGVASETPALVTPTARMPVEFSLDQNYPNPFNPVTEITYALPRDAHVTLRVYNVQGAQVATLAEADQKVGFYTVRWDAEEQASGVYFCVLTAGEFSRTIKMVLMK
jgi:hypothetical protein